MIQGVVFDLFGTLVMIGDQKHPYRRLMKIARERGRHPKPDDARAIMTLEIGLAGAAKFFDVNLSVAELAELELDLYSELATVRLYDDSLDAIFKLRDAGIKIGVCSNLALPYSIAAKLLLPALDCYSWSFEVGAIKPEAKIYQHACAGLGCSPETVVMMGDTVQADVSGPQRIGMQGLHVQRERGVGVMQLVEALLGCSGGVSGGAPQ